MTVYQRVLLAVDLTPDSLLIGLRARALAAALDAQMKILHVVEPIPIAVPPSDPIAPIALTPLLTDLIELAQEHIARLAQELGLPETCGSVVVGNTKREIVRAADGMDLIVIGSRERHGLAFFITPTEDVVVHRAPCDVLAIRLPTETLSKAKEK